jgi:DNA polymerase elongation subunit (family B)
MSIRYRQHVQSEIEYIKELGCFDWFTDNKYIVETDSIYIPSYKKKVIGILDNDIQKVYDIEVEKVHNFLTNGVVAHNCSLYPTTIIAYNIDYSTLVPDDSDIPNSKCHVFTWSDHVSCKDDPKVIRKNKLTEYIKEEEDELKKMREERDKKLNKFRRNEIQKEIDERVEKLKPYREERSEITKSINKNVLCAERHYRFIKEPKGVLPTILQNLLDARKNTRGEIKKHNKEIEKLEKSDDNKQKIDDLNTLNNVLDKRQWAYKISANR